MLKIMIAGLDDTEKDSAVAEENVSLIYRKPYCADDMISLQSDAPGFVVAQLEDSIEPVFGFLRAPFKMKVPFGERRVCYSPKSFTGDSHLLRARLATPEEVNRYRNLALNQLDCNENTGLYPHASANVETRGEAVFAARNAINGNTVNHGHGVWPFESWGINRQENAEITVDFGRSVLLDKIVVVLRADFPHDNWWKQATIRFSDNSSFTLHLTKTDRSQTFLIEPRMVDWATMGELQKDETDLSPFPALTQFEFWGTNSK